MNKLEIREKLIAEIKQVENLHLLKVLYDILSAETGEKFYNLNRDQISAIEEAKQQYKEGEFFTNEEVDRETEEWLKQ
ncbi:hypothetical protein [Salinimicrobium sediminilitoris]|uniref:hypothetical protein n=1 Tax=Salinimicrobium sediminilitoris TaxID=2876715 RepID=UPI001E5F4766|nr:hypothetical protein [Salinimicrobium sediminilitoris]MCC8360099.1 hypothetical protein [Salinimicrobium sediminilitoris]